VRAKILLVDDRPENLYALEAILEPLNQELIQAGSGNEALKQILLNDFAVILMDVMMPGLSGVETARFVKERDRSRHVPIIFITALDEDIESILEGYSVGAVDYIRKPFNAAILRSKVSVFVELFRKEQQLKQQALLIQEALIREAERQRVQQKQEFEQKHLLELNEQLENRVVERTTELVEANREMESFCYSVAHDLRAPVRNIIATSKIMQEDMGEKLGPEGVEQLQCQAKSARTMATLIDDLLRLYRLNQKELVREKLHLSKLAKKTAADCMKHYPDSTWALEIEDGLYASADKGLIEALLYNLFDNAFKYSPSGGVVQFCKNAEKGFCLKDEGIGFEMAFHSKLFKPFERLVGNDYPGTGIGLAIVHKIVTRHGGQVWAEGEPGKGSSFYFTL
jgi:hypothetical protein